MQFVKLRLLLVSVVHSVYVCVCVCVRVRRSVAPPMHIYPCVYISVIRYLSLYLSLSVYICLVTCLWAGTTTGHQVKLEKRKIRAAAVNEVLGVSLLSVRGVCRSEKGVAVALAIDRWRALTGVVR
eukprot:GHVU01053229.1.p1 GENE.GHVU01053229.1~~GHVU01053229.1.p1  ORF type:complete len:126 (+),score=1.07 GHVU01053229.1:129-506(+)